jgi:hypothetical protein
MNNLKLSDEQIDAICSALDQQAVNRESTGLELDLQLAAVYDKIRKEIRAQFPLTSSMKKLVTELEV